MAFSRRLRGAFDSRDLPSRHQTVVDSDGELLAFEQNAFDVANLGLEQCFGTVQRRKKGGSAFMLLMQAIGTCDVEAMTSSIDETVKADQTSHLRAVAPADDGDMTVRGKIREDPPHFGGQDGKFWPGDDRRQRPIVVEKNGRTLLGK